MRRSCLLMALSIAGGACAPAATRLKELVALEGVRDNQLIGYGLVVGLNGTGDRRQTVFSAQSLTNMLQQMGVSVPPTAIQVRNTAAVMVTGTLPPFAQPGSRIDVTAAAIGDAANLQGGLLVMTTLKGVDGQPYAMAQGPVVTGGFIAGRGGTSQTLNHPTVGRVPGGAIVERPAPSVAPSSRLRLQLRQADFTTAARIAEAVNKKFPSAGPIAKAENSVVIQVAVPPEYAARSIEFVAELERVQVDADRPARVVINERTGTIVMGKEVRVSPVAIMHGNLSVQIETSFAVSQPNPLSQGTTQVVPQIGVGVKEEKARNIVLKEGATVEELVRALMAIGSTPRDVIAILQSLRSAGALEAELEVV
ncbi:MAG: flagellar basal body P-ring protein FlgI [Acidobacteria bacterium]|nr:flagellar basal body P-ring protein FlgI [Acidobacteriota bacterium]MBI3472515.1 flagellar basal body P-ring protein FlgI [Candidatus Solibacter usitatus]